MTDDERIKNILLSTKLGPLTPFYGIVNGGCECGKQPNPTHKPGKHPRAGGWQNSNATTDLQTIAQWIKQYPNANFAIITGVETVVLDLDIRPGKNGVAELSLLEAGAGRCLPRTVTVLSGSGTGARHLYFKVPSGLGQLKKPKGTMAIDFQRSRQAVIVPGSLHQSGEYYRFAPGLSPAEVEVAELPGWFLELMQAPAASSRTTTVFSDDIEELFEELLKMGPPPGSVPPGRLRPDDVVKFKMANVSKRKYPEPRSQPGMNVRLGKYIKSLDGRVFGNHKLLSKAGAKNKAMVWCPKVSS